MLFLDELPEFTRGTLEVLRQPMEDGQVTISRIGGNATFPCKFMLVAAMNPCPCGYFGHPSIACTCPPRTVERYLAKISGPLLDRMDLHIEVPPVNFEELTDGKKAEASAEIRKRVNAARQRQVERYAGQSYTCNADVPAALLWELCQVTPEADRLFKRAFDKFGFSARSYNRVLKVARTIADLEESDMVEAPHAAEAVQYRSLDRKYWAQ